MPPCHDLQGRLEARENKMNEAPSASPTPPAPARRKLLRRLSAAIGLAAVVALAWGGWRLATRSTETLEDQYILATVQRGDIEDLVSATGSLQPRDYVDVGAQVSGQLKVIHVEVGSEVKEGDLLAEIDAEQSAAKVEASKAQLRSQQAQMAERQMTLAKAERDLARQRRLMAEEGTTLETLQNAETAVRTAQAQAAALQAQMEQLQASLRVEEANLKYTRIYAPMSGTVVSISARKGQTLNANQQAPTLMRVADLSTMLVQTQVSEADVAKLRRGMQAYFTTLGSQGQRWWGKLQKIEPTPTVNNNVVLYNALFEVPNDNRRLMTQMTAQVFFVAAQAHDVLTVPMGALTLERRSRRGPRGAASEPATTASASATISAGASDAIPAARAASDPRASARNGAGEGLRDRPHDPRRNGAGGPAAAPGVHPRKAKVRVVAADDSIAERDVTIGISNRVHAQVLSGLKEGDRVIAGTRVKASEQRNAAQQGSGGPGALGGPGGPAGAGGPGMGGLAGGGMAGGARGR